LQEELPYFIMKRLLQIPRQNSGVSLVEPSMMDRNYSLVLDGKINFVR
jgi:hypothetical protein